MKVLFHPSFDNGYYIDLNKGSYTLGTKIVGLEGLLEHLSLLNGLCGRYKSDGERAAAYLNHVGKCTKGTWLEKSFKNDGLGVAKCLLRWRDNLIMAGWRPSMSGTDKTPKLQLLSNIEDSWKASMKGTADRWLELAMLADNHTILIEGDEIECTCLKDQLPLLVQKVLDAYHANYAEYPEEVRIPDELKVKVLHYNDLRDAYRQVAAGKLNGDVIINRDNVSLNHILLAWGKPLLDATIQGSNPLSLQLFKLAPSVFSRPLNIQNLLSYFQLPVGPIPRRLRTALSNVLVSDGGFGEIDWDDEKMTEEKERELREAGISTKWEQAIWEYVQDKEGKSKFSREEREAKRSFLNPITSDAYSKDGGIPVQDLKAYISAIDQWAAQFADKDKKKEPEDEEEDEKDEKEKQDEVLQAQMGTVISYFKQFLGTLEGRDSIPYKELEKSINTIYQPTSIVQARAQVGSVQAVDSYQQLVDTPESLLWLDCCGADVIKDRYDFLSAEERSWLNRQESICVPRLQDILELNRKEMITTLSKIQSGITLVTADYHHNLKMTEHPLIAELKMQRGDRLKISEGSTELPLTDDKEVIKREPQLKYDLGPITYTGRDESNTSIDALINYPFDYVVQYVARFGEPSKKELGSIRKVMGDVAHLFIQSLVNDVKDIPEKERLNEMSELLEKEYDLRLDKAVQSKGLALLLKENEVEYCNFRFLLKVSVNTLVDIMKKKSLVPVGSEVKCIEPVFSDGSPFNARIDLELKDENGRAVIFDFKWTYVDSFRKKIEKCKAVQLELYRQELIKQGKDVSAVGYYLLPKCVLETSDYETLKDSRTNKEIIHHIDPVQDIELFERIQNSVSQRKKEIKSGCIEEGEGMDIINLAYSKKMLRDGNMLWVGTPKQDRVTRNNPDPPVREVIKDSKFVFINRPESRFHKAKPEHGNNNIPLNEKETTYPLMKGRLK